MLTDPEKKQPIAEWYRDAFKAFYGNRDTVLGRLDQDDTAYVDTTRKVIDSADYLADHIGEVPVWVIACIEGRTDNGLPLIWQASQWGSLLPAVWSFQLAARARGLASCYTTLHLAKEKEAAKLLGIPSTSCRAPSSRWPTPWAAPTSSPGLAATSIASSTTKPGDGRGPPPARGGCSRVHDG